MSEKDTQRTSGNVSRRRVLQATGAATVATVAFTGAASAHKPSEIRFCGCSQICVEGNASAGDKGKVWISTGDGFRNKTIDYNFCYDNLSSGEKIVGLEFDEGDKTHLVCNPNTCANADGERDALENSTGLSCGNPGVKVNTNQCREWWDDDNGPTPPDNPNKGGNKGNRGKGNKGNKGNRGKGNKGNKGNRGKSNKGNKGNRGKSNKGNKGNKGNRGKGKN